MNRLKQAWLALFNRKPKPRPKLTPSQEMSAKLRAWRPIGGQFKYLGRTMVVCAHGDWQFIGCRSHWRAGLHADYADNHGVLHSISFSPTEALAIMAAQPKPKKSKGKKKAAQTVEGGEGG